MGIPPPKTPWQRLPPRSRWLILGAVAITYAGLAWSDLQQSKREREAADA